MKAPQRTGRVVSFALAALLIATPGLAQDAAELDLARQILAAAQGESIRKNREFCGTIGLDQFGRLLAAKPRRGRSDSCLPRDPRDAVEIVASFHTHSNYHEDADSEVPSTDDVIGDMEEGLDGYVSTPGGRLWFIDGQTGVARQICGVGCLPSDPDFVPEDFGPVATRYTLEDLRRRENEY